MVKQYIKEKHFEPINILIVFLIGIASILFLTGLFNTFDLSASLQKTIVITVSAIYFVATVFFLWPKKTLTPIEIEPQIIEKEVIREKPIIKYQKIQETQKEKEKPIEKKENEEKSKKENLEKTKIALVEVEKKKQKKSKYVGSTYNERYHLRSCRFAGVIKKKYLIEEEDKKFFKLRGYAPCKVCNPDKN